MEYTSIEMFQLVLVFIVLPSMAFLAGFVIGRISGAKNLMLVKHYLWLMKGKRNKVDGKLEGIEEVIEAIQRGSE